jgi:hypothetical protein
MMPVDLVIERKLSVPLYKGKPVPKRLFVSFWTGNSISAPIYTPEMVKDLHPEMDNQSPEMVPGYYCCKILGIGTTAKIIGMELEDKSALILSYKGEISPSLKVDQCYIIEYGLSDKMVVWQLGRQ